MFDSKMPIPDELLLQVMKPGRYIGNEINMVRKDPGQIPIRFAFCFPDVYEVGMSHLGLQILYYFLNRREDTYCERVFTPWIDMADMMKERNIPLFSLETGSPLQEFDFIGFTLQYEMCYTNVLLMLDLAGIPFYAAERGEDFPIICAGGPCVYNPEPLAELVDFFYIGEGEAGLDEIMDIYKDYKTCRRGKQAFLRRIANMPGIYVPSLYHVSYHEDGTIKAMAPICPEAPEKVKKLIQSDINGVFYPDKQLVPLIETVHDRVTLELFRGCIRGCRFCQAGFVYRPVREKSVGELMEQAKTLVKTSGHEEISLVSLSTSDYSEFMDLANQLLDEFLMENVNISLPSLRIDSFSLDLMEKVQKGRKGGLTFAPEAGTQRLRDVINKGITEDDILSGSRLAFETGIERVKLYFMIGLPTEKEEDLDGIAILGEAIVEEYYKLPKEKRKRPVAITLSTSCFVPKPFTPFQWEPQNSYGLFMEKQKHIKQKINKKQIKYNYHDANTSFMEGVLARGDRRLAKAIIKAYQLGARYDGWSEHFHIGLWMQAFEETGIDPAFYTTRPRSYDEVLPWDFIDIGVKKEYLVQESQKAVQEKVTPNCRTQCMGCGAAVWNGGVCVE